MREGRIIIWRRYVCVQHFSPIGVLSNTVSGTYILPRLRGADHRDLSWIFKAQPSRIGLLNVYRLTSEHNRPRMSHIDHFVSSNVHHFEESWWAKCMQSVQSVTKCAMLIKLIRVHSESDVTTSGPRSARCAPWACMQFHVHQHGFTVSSSNFTTISTTYNSAYFTKFAVRKALFENIAGRRTQQVAALTWVLRLNSSACFLHVVRLHTRNAGR